MIISYFSKILDPSSYLTFAVVDDNGGVNASIETSHSWIYYLVPVLLMSLFLFVIDFYIETYVSQKTDPIYTAKLGKYFNNGFKFKNVKFK